MLNRMLVIPRLLKEGNPKTYSSGRWGHAGSCSGGPEHSQAGPSGLHIFHLFSRRTFCSVTVNERSVSVKRIEQIAGSTKGHEGTLAGGVPSRLELLRRSVRYSAGLASASRSEFIRIKG